MTIAWTTLDAIKLRLAKMQEAIDGVAKAYPQAPNSLATANMPLFINFSGHADYDYIGLGADYYVVTRAFKMFLVVLSRGSGVQGEAERKAEPFFDRVVQYFAARPMMGLPGVRGSKINSDEGVSIITYAGEQYYCAQFDDTVEYIEKRVYAPNE